MNEINPKTVNTNKISPIAPRIRPNSAFLKQGGLFNEILTSQIEKGSDAGPLKETSTLPEIQGSFKAQQLSLSLDQGQLTRELESSLDLFETYTSWLGDPGKTLKQTHGLLEQVLSRTKSLERDLEDQGDSGTELKEILTRLMTTAEVERIKFDRGDYTG